jgi:hypothetical protein
MQQVGFSYKMEAQLSIHPLSLHVCYGKTLPYLT